jgi:RimJ/RimL family protein N-acetyltransferase
LDAQRADGAFVAADRLSQLTLRRSLKLRDDERMTVNRAPSLTPPPLSSPRLDLEPLRVQHAREMAPLLDDADLYTYTGGEPPTLSQLQDRYRPQTAGGSPDGSQCWLNWVLRRREDGRVVGYVQSTLTVEDGHPVAEVAWVVGAPFQAHGYATEAAQVMVSWLRAHDVVTVRAHVRPDHVASQGVARAAGLTASGIVVDGEIRWEG